VGVIDRRKQIEEASDLYALRTHPGKFDGNHNTEIIASVKGFLAGAEWDAERSERLERENAELKSKLAEIPPKILHLLEEARTLIERMLRRAERMHDMPEVGECMMWLSRCPAQTRTTEGSAPDE
jgi:hypothetical protein